MIAKFHTVLHVVLTSMAQLSYLCDYDSFFDHQQLTPAGGMSSTVLADIVSAHIKVDLDHPTASSSFLLPLVA